MRQQQFQRQMQDADGDGILDKDERAGQKYVKNSSVNNTKQNLNDADGDGILDKNEKAGYKYIKDSVTYKDILKNDEKDGIKNAAMILGKAIVKDNIREYDLKNLKPDPSQIDIFKKGHHIEKPPVKLDDWGKIYKEFSSALNGNDETLFENKSREYAKYLDTLIDKGLINESKYKEASDYANNDYLKFKNEHNIKPQNSR